MRALRMLPSVQDPLTELMLRVAAGDRAAFAPLRNLIPGTDMTEVLPGEAVDSIRDCLGDAACTGFEFTWEERACRALPRRIGRDDDPRGLVLVVECVTR